MNQSLASLASTASEMLARIKPYLAPERLMVLQEKISSWQASVQRAAEQMPHEPLPPLVMRPQGLPRSLDPLYFTLVTNPYELD